MDERLYERAKELAKMELQNERYKKLHASIMEIMGEYGKDLDVPYIDVIEELENLCLWMVDHEIEHTIIYL